MVDEEDEVPVPFPKRVIDCFKLGINGLVGQGLDDSELVDALSSYPDVILLALIQALNKSLFSLVILLLTHQD